MKNQIAAMAVKKTARIAPLSNTILRSPSGGEDRHCQAVRPRINATVANQIQPQAQPTDLPPASDDFPDKALAASKGRTNTGRITNLIGKRIRLMALTCPDNQP